MHYGFFHYFQVFTTQSSLASQVVGQYKSLKVYEINKYIKIPL